MVKYNVFVSLPVLPTTMWYPSTLSELTAVSLTPNLPASAVVIVAENEASSASAAASSFNVSSAAGAPPIKSETTFLT